MDNNSQTPVTPVVPQEVQDHLTKFQEELAALMKAHNIVIDCVLTFPMYKIYPDEVKLAVKVISNHGGQYQVSYMYKEPEVKTG